MSKSDFLTRRQVKGAVKLLILVCLFLVYRILDRYVFIVPDSDKFVKVVQPNENKAEHVLDLNQADSMDLVALPGIGPVLSRRIIKFREKLGRFNDVEHLRKVYGLKPEVYEKIAHRFCVDVMADKPATVVRTVPTEREEDVANVVEEKPTTRVAVEKAKVDINSADSLELVAVYGIGPVFAQRILERRRALGSFHSIEQLKEVKGIFGESYDRIASQLAVGSEQSAKAAIRINSWPVDSLAAHPYISWKNAKLIGAYRNAHGPFTSLEDCSRMKVVPPEFWKRVGPYLRF